MGSMLQISDPLASIPAKLLTAAFVILAIWKGPAALELVLSWTINLYLRFSQRILHQHNAGEQLPSAPYVWPNGQGNMAKFIHGKENSLQWGQKYGSVYRIWSGMTGEVVVTKPEHIKAVFKDSNNHTKAVDNNSGFIMQRLLGQCVGLISNARWSRMRPPFDLVFSHTIVRGYTELVVRETRRHFAALAPQMMAAAGSSGQNGQGQLDPVADLKMLPFAVVARILYGDHLDDGMLSELYAIVPLRERLFGYVIRGGLTRFRWAAWLPLAGVRAAFRELDDFERRWEAFNDAAYRAATSAAEKKEKLVDGATPPPPPPPIVALYESGRLSKPELLQTIDEILFANLDVTMGGVSWAVVFQAFDRRVQEKLRDEIRAQRLEYQQQQAGEKRNPDHAALSSGSDRFSTPTTGCASVPASYLSSTTSFLHACVLEAARLKPLAAFSVPSSAPSERVVEGFAVPAGTNFVVDSHALNLRNPFWGADAAAFRPERFLERRQSAELRYNYWRFGFGPRQCLGKYLADLMVNALLVELVDCYALSVPGDKDEWRRDMETWIMHPVIKLACQPLEKGGL